MRSFLGVLALLGLAASAGASDPAPTRVYDLSWTIEVSDIPEGASEAVLWIALPQALTEQTVRDLTLDRPYTRVEDPDFGNAVARVTIEHPSSTERVTATAVVTRHAVTSPIPAELTDAERELYLREEALVSLDGDVKKVAKKAGETARARYDFVLASMDYDKTVPGWGKGDTQRACEVGKGNCTDFHSMYMSLSRLDGVPAVFEMGYSTTPEGETDRVGGYHCWAWFHQNGAWTPVDISEADKHPEKAEYFYGHLDADRITFSRGRDVRLPGMKGEPLNYLPSGAYVEVDGTPHDAVARSISYEVSTP